MGTEDQTPTGTPSNGEEVPKTPTPQRKSLGTDPTMPISLRRDNNVEKNAPTVVPTSSTPSNSTTDEEWAGTEQTLVGVPAPAQQQQSEDDSSNWLGAEKTALPTNRPTDENGDQWTGNEQTLVGAPVPKGLAPAQSSEDEWLGNDATIIGTPAPQGKPGHEPGAITTGGSRKTNSTMDDGWHLKGRQGALTGQTIGDYEVGGILGEGGMGTVYRAKQISLKRRVALKVLPPHLASNEQMRQRFEQEATTASLLNSPHVVQVFAAGTHQDMVYFVMEFVEGVDLAEKISEKNDAAQLFTPDEAANFVIQAARGLAEAGRHGIVHRDIKPANLMITTKGVVKIADFGISKIAGEHGLTMTGTAVGTPAYCSPEQGRGDQVDGRADIYSLGVVFYELLTGKKPFDGATANALIYQHNYAEPTLITALRAEVPDAYQAVALKCLQKDPDKRYQDANELVGDLERVRAGSAPMTALMNAFGTGADEAMRRLGIRQRRIWPYIVAALVLVSIIGGIVVWQTQATAEQQTAQNEIARLKGNLAVLDQPQPIPQSSLDDLSALGKYVDEEDADYARWQTKLQRVGQLQKRLNRLDTDTLPPATLRLESISDLDKYKEDVGSEGQDVARWQGRIDAAVAAIANLRTTLSELDKSPVVSTAQAEKLNPALAQLSIIAGENDEDVKRWQGRLNTSRDRVGQLRANLAVLDKADTVITLINITAIKRDLDALIVLVGNEDEQVRKWTVALQARQNRIVEMRKNLERLDAVEWATIGLQAAIKDDLQAYTAIAEKNDSDLVRWQRKVDASLNRIKNLRDSLSLLDEPEALNVTQQRQAEERLADYRALVSPDDGQLQAWQNRLRDERDAQAAMQDTLKRFDDDKLMTVVELDATTKAVETLGRLGALPEAQQRLYEQRLTKEKQQLEALRLSLRGRDGADVTIDQALVDDLNLLARLAGEEDPDVKQWRQRVNDYERLHDILVTLDKIEPLPVEVEKHLAAFTKIVGPASLEVKRWAAKVRRVTELRTMLKPLDDVAPMPEDALIKAQALVKEVGEQDPQAKAYLTKANKVTDLIKSLKEELAGQYILPPKALRNRRDLVALIGTEDEEVANLVTRVTVLNGPGKPTWASESGRDAFGLWADLTINGVTQRFRYIPSGSFLMGSPEKEIGRDKDETQVFVTLSRSFWLADTECTQGFWAVVFGPSDSRFKSPDYPVERVSYNACKAFCERLSTKIPGLRARLPTEAEWEYACRAGSTAPYASHVGAVAIDKLDTISWFKGTTPTTQGVKRRFGNALGLFDMHGNVWEWCEDRYGTYSPTAVTDPIGREQEERVARGGSWGDNPDKIRAANRLAVREDMRTLYLGVRIAIAVDWPSGQEPSPNNAAEQVAEIKTSAP